MLPVEAEGDLRSPPLPWILSVFAGLFPVTMNSIRIVCEKSALSPSCVCVCLCLSVSLCVAVC